MLISEKHDPEIGLAGGFATLLDRKNMVGVRLRVSLLKKACAQTLGTSPVAIVPVGQARAGRPASRARYMASCKGRQRAIPLGTITLTADTIFDEYP
jgi:hypothetical protein